MILEGWETNKMIASAECLNRLSSNGGRKENPGTPE
jgi:hypothetical protein